MITANMVELGTAFLANFIDNRRTIVAESDRPALNRYLDERSTSFESVCGLLSDDGSNNDWMGSFGRLASNAKQFVSQRNAADALIAAIAAA